MGEQQRPSERWREIVLERQRQMDAAYAALGRTSADFWGRRADRYRAFRPVASPDDPVVVRVTELAGPAGTVLDVGAGTGRYALALAPRVGHVTAVEPSDAMAGHMRAAAEESKYTNLAVVEATWQDAEVEPADVVLCSHVLYPHAEVVPFIKKLEAHARTAVVLAMMVTWAEPPLMADLWRRFHGDERRGQPESFDTIAVLHELGIPTNVEVERLPADLPMWAFADPDDAVPVLREHLILAPDPERDAEIRAAVAALPRAADGRLVVPGPERAVACIWWRRDGPRRPPL
jgi:SAM-dependent methyltransferase